MDRVKNAGDVDFPSDPVSCRVVSAARADVIGKSERSGVEVADLLYVVAAGAGFVVCLVTVRAVDSRTNR
jgi:hypothetical protein